MASTKDLKKRIGTVKNTQQTTRAMKMVSAAKLRRAQEAIQNQRPFAIRVAELLNELLASVEVKGKHPLILRDKDEDVQMNKKILLVVVTSDRGLCGGFNTSIIKTAQRWITATTPQGHSIELACVGRKGNEFFKSRKMKIAGYYPDIGGKVTFAKAKNLAQLVTEKYLSGEVDEVKFVYNEFKNAVTQKPVVENFLPVRVKAIDTLNLDPKNPPVLRKYIVKPSPEELLEELLSKNFSIQAFRILLESQAGEHGARMSAMENATKNAGEMIRKLTLQYNKQRQAGITKELLEIIAGSESQKG